MQKKMSAKTIRALLKLKAFALALPVSALAFIATLIYVAAVFRYWRLLYVDALAILSLASVASLLSQWKLYIAYVREGIEALRQERVEWWILTIVGVVVLIASYISVLLPPSEEYSSWCSFRQDFNLVVYGSPILVPLAHLAFERLRWRWNSKTATIRLAAGKLTVTLFSTSIVDKDYSGDINATFSRFIFSVEVSRTETSAVIRSILPALIILLISLLSNFVPDLSQRATIAGGILLALLLHHLAVSAGIPQVAYLIYFDAFILINNTLILLQFVLTVIEIIFERRQYPVEKRKHASHLTLIELIVIWLAAQGSLVWLFLI